MLTFAEDTAIRKENRKNMDVIFRFHVKQWSIFLFFFESKKSTDQVISINDIILFFPDNQGQFFTQYIGNCLDKHIEESLVIKKVWGSTYKFQNETLFEKFLEVQWMNEEHSM